MRLRNAECGGTIRIVMVTLTAKIPGGAKPKTTRRMVGFELIQLIP